MIISSQEAGEGRLKVQIQVHSELDDFVVGGTARYTCYLRPTGLRHLKVRVASRVNPAGPLRFSIGEEDGLARFRKTIEVPPRAPNSLRKGSAQRYTIDATLERTHGGVLPSSVTAKTDARDAQDGLWEHIVRQSIHVPLRTVPRET